MSSQLQSQKTLYVDAMAALVNVVQELSHARDLETIISIVREAARNLTHADGATFVLLENDNCFYVEENAIGPLWKGRRFPLSTCISGWVMEKKIPAVVEDIYQDPRIPIDAYRPTFVKSLVMVPIRHKKPIGAIGNYWAHQHKASPQEVALLQALADTTSVALENAELYAELRRKVATLEEQEKHIQSQHETLEIFTRALAHDLKEPLRTLKSYSELILETPTLNKEMQKYFQYISAATLRMDKLVNTVFLYMQLDTTQKNSYSSCVVNEIIVAIEQDLQTLIKEHSAIITKAPLPIVLAHPVQMTQLLQNLIVNAIRHNEKSISINISVEEKDNHWLFAISDNGKGIKAEDLKKIFHAFKRLENSDDCLGLGLAICQKIINMHGGEIWCESQLGEGATFYFTLPKAVVSKLEAPAASNAASEIIEAKNMLSQANIILVDDSESDMDLAKTIFFKKNHLHCNLFEASSGETALNLCHELIDTNDLVDLMLVDINMPGMDGFELIEKMRESNILKNIPVIMFTGSTYDKDHQRAKNLGVTGYMLKPPPFGSLKTLLQQISSLKLLTVGKENYLLRAT